MSTDRESGAESLQNKLQDIFECVKLFEVEGGSLPAGGDSPTHGFGKYRYSISVELAILKVRILLCVYRYSNFRVDLYRAVQLARDCNTDFASSGL